MEVTESQHVVELSSLEFAEPMVFCCNVLLWLLSAGIVFLSTVSWVESSGEQEVAVFGQTAAYF